MRFFAPVNSGLVPIVGSQETSAKIPRTSSMKPHEHQPPILPSVRSFSFLDDQRCFETNFPLLRPPMSSLFRNPKNRQASCPFWPPEAFLLDLLPTRLAPCCRACSGKCSCTLWPWRGEVIILIPAPRAPRRHVEKGKKRCSKALALERNEI